MYHGRMTPVSRASRCHHERDRPVSNATSTTRAARWRPPPAKCRSSRAAQCASRAAPMSRRRYTCRASAEMARMASSSPHATATAVLPTPVGPTRTGTRGRSAPPKPSLQLVLRQLYDRGPPVHVVRREGRAEQPTHQLPHLFELEPLARLDRRPACEGGGEALEPV